VAIVIIILVVVVCVKKGMCPKKDVGVRPTREIASNYHPPPPPALIPTARQYPNPFHPIFTVPIPRHASCIGYPYPQPANFKNSRLPQINRVT
jgi:hypothetical protein